MTKAAAENAESMESAAFIEKLKQQS